MRGFDFGFILQFSDECLCSMRHLMLLLGVGYEWVAVETDGE